MMGTESLEDGCAGKKETGYASVEVLEAREL